MEKLTFKQITRNLLKDKFGLVLVRNHEVLEQWKKTSILQKISEYEQQTLLRLQNTLIKRCVSWNEFELSEWFIGPLISLVEFENDDFSLFAFHDLTAQIDDYEITGKPDVMFARGIDEAQIPYFFFNEYKRQTDPDGNPQTQLLGAMLAAQSLNKNDKPIYGIYVIGKFWTFVILHGNQWCESNSYVSDDQDIFEIFRLLRGLKELIYKNLAC
jgi:hypothetical protein